MISHPQDICRFDLPQVQYRKTAAYSRNVGNYFERQR